MSHPTGRIEIAPHHIIESEAQLRRIYDAPSEFAKKKSLDHLDSHCRDFIAAAPFLVLASRDANGRADCSPRGERPGFVQVLDRRHMVLPDRPGNNRLDTMINLLSYPGIGMLFIIPGIRETLRVNGRARIITEPSILERHTVEGKQPKSAMLIRVDEAFLHCAKALMRSRLWKPETWPDKGVVASPGKIWADQVQGLDAEKMDEDLEVSLPMELY